MSTQSRGETIPCPVCGARVRLPARPVSGSIHCPACKHVLRPSANNRDPIANNGPCSPLPISQFEAPWQPQRTVRVASSGRRKWMLMLLLAFIVLTVTSALVVIPVLLPKDPREQVLREYLTALSLGDLARAAKFGVLDDPPALRSFIDSVWLEAEEESFEGSFKPIADFHAKISEKYQPAGEVFLRKDMTGTLAKVINAADAIRQTTAQPGDPLENTLAGIEMLQEALGEKAPQLEETPTKPGESPTKRSQSIRPPRDELDRAVAFAERYVGALQSIQGVVSGGPSQSAASVTYEQLVDTWRPELDAGQAQLLNQFRQNRTKWNKALGREFLQIREEGPFRMLRSRWEAKVWLTGQSSAEKPKTVKATLLRFQLGLIDTGWKVWEIRATD